MARLEHIADVVSPKAAALFEGLKLSLSIGCYNLMVRMDNSIVVDPMNLTEGHSMVAAPVLDDCCSILSELGKVTIEHCIVYIESNVVVHELARWGFVNNPSVWADAPLIFLFNF